jgi:hypothetical protein
LQGTHLTNGASYILQKQDLSDQFDLEFYLSKVGEFIGTKLIEDLVLCKYLSNVTTLNLEGAKNLTDVFNYLIFENIRPASRLYMRVNIWQTLKS